MRLQPGRGGGSSPEEAFRKTGRVDLRLRDGTGHVLLSGRALRDGKSPRTKESPGCCTNRCANKFTAVHFALRSPWKAKLSPRHQPVKRLSKAKHQCSESPHGLNKV